MKKEGLMLFVFVSLTFISLVFSMSVVSAAPGDVIWEINVDYGDGSLITDVVADSSGVYVSSMVGITERWRIDKYDLNDGSEIWTVADEISGFGGESAYSLDIDSTGIYSGGTQDSKWRVEKRSLSDGSIIWEKTANDQSNTDWDRTRNVAVYNGEFYAVGLVGTFGDSSGHFTKERRAASDGTVVWQKSDGQTGLVPLPNVIVADSSGVYVGGSGTTPVFSDLWKVSKFQKADGLTSIWSKSTDLSTGDDLIFDMGVDSSGIYIIGGQDDYTKWRVEKRSLSDGSIIWEKVVDQSGGIDYASDVYVGTDGVYIIGGINGQTAGLGFEKFKVEKRSLSDGSIIWEKELDLSTGLEAPGGIYVYNNEVYIGGGSAKANGYSQLFLAKLSNFPVVPSICANTPNPGHCGTDVYIKVNGDDVSLQSAASSGLLKNIISGGSYTGVINFGQKGEEILIKVNNSEKSLQQAINEGSLCSTSGSYGSYLTNKPNPGHYATEIMVVNNSGAEKSLQKMIDDKEFCAIVGVCGSTQDSCDVGTYSDLTDTSTQYLWSCAGLDGDTQCSLDKLPVYYTLTVSKNPTSGGTVTGTGISCGSDCTESFVNGKQTTLFASAASGYSFSSWTGCNSVTGNYCTVTMNSAKTVTANFISGGTSGDISCFAQGSWNGAGWYGSCTATCSSGSATDPTVDDLWGCYASVSGPNLYCTTSDATGCWCSAKCS